MSKGFMLSEALKLATNAHYGMMDKGGNPYILHPLKVMYYLKSDDEELCSIALLHDVIEDTSTTYEDLLSVGISQRVIAAVRCLTKQRGQTYEEYKECVFSNEDAMRVKLCDLRHNTDLRRLKGVTEKDLARVVKYCEFYKQIEERLKNV